MVLLCIFFFSWIINIPFKSIIISIFSGHGLRRRSMSIRIGSNEANEGKMKMETAVATLATTTSTTSEASGEAEVSSTISSDDEIAVGEGHSGLKYEKKLQYRYGISFG